MTDMENPLPESGYSIGKVYAVEQLVRQREDSDTPHLGKATFSWDWRRLPDRGMFEVALSLTIFPSEKRPDYMLIATVGQFEQTTAKPSVPLSDFVTAQAVAILLPYARQFLSNLTANSLYGCFYLPTINVVKMMSTVDPKKATGYTEPVAPGWQPEPASVN